MKKSIPLFCLVMAAVLVLEPVISGAQKFIHPGIDQTSGDLALMKSKVLNGEQPYKDAFERLRLAVDSGFVVKAHAHVLRGPYGRPNIGGDDLSKSANMAYNYALAWYVTDDKKYANKAIEILNAWSPVLWDLDYNDAKLLAAWTGHMLCNAAEILRYTNAGWQQKDISKFTNMLMTVYYPLMRFYYPQANGNWDGAIIHSILAIAVFTDNRALFNNAVDHFLHGPVNGSIFKYIYPNGQCQETTRDQAHVQLGLGEFAGAAQIAFTQGVDFFSLANNRIALGYEYTARFVLGEKPHSYGIFSERARTLRDDYEYVYRHYKALGIAIPFTQKAADSITPKTSRSVLTSVRTNYGNKGKEVEHTTKGIKGIAGANNIPSTPFPANSIIVSAGEDIQKAIDSAAQAGKWVVVKAGVHMLPHTLKMPANVTLAGEGLASKIILDPASGDRETIINARNDMHDVTIRDLVIECGLKTETHSDPNSVRSYRGGYNRGGILFRTTKEDLIKNVQLLNVTVQNATYNGVFINGASNVEITNCVFNENGVSVAPGQKLLHNLLITHCSNVSIKNSRLVTSALGSGISVAKSSNISITECEIARNGYYGIIVSESSDIAISDNLIEANDRSGIMVEFLHKGSDKINITNNLIHYNNGYGVETYAATQSTIANNIYAGNGSNATQQKVSNEKIILMQ